MSALQLIPLNKLVESDDNVRRTERKRDIDTLAASIAAHGLLQNLTVTAREDGKFAVVAGARRHAALKLLVRQGERATAKKKRRLTALDAEIERIDSELKGIEDGPDADTLWDRREALDGERDAIVEAARTYDTALMAHAGAIVGVDRDGKPTIQRGLIRRADLKTLDKLRNKARAAEDSTEDDDAGAPAGASLSKALTRDLTLIGRGDMRRVGAWQPLRLTDEHLSAGVDRETVVRAVIQNPNLTPSPVPALRIAFQTHDGVPLGHWLVFPSDDVVPAMSEIEIRGRLAWPTEGVPRGVALVRSMQDFDGFSGGEWRFPGPGGETHNID